MKTTEGNFIARAETVIRASPGEVWRALMDPKMIKQYLFDTEVETDWQEGSPIIYRGEWEGRVYEDKGRIIKIDPEKELTTTFWSELGGKPDLPENYKTVSYSLQGNGDMTTVTITQDGNASVEEATHSTENWKLVLGKLKEAIES